MADIRHFTVTLRQRTRRSGNTHLYLDINIDGKRRTEALGLSLTGGTSRADRAADRDAMRHAESVRAQRIIELQRLQLGMATDTGSDVLFYDFFDKIASRKQGTTLTSWLNCKARLLRYWPDTSLLLRDIDRRWVQGFRDWLDSSAAWETDPRRQGGKGRPLAEGTKALLFQKLCSALHMAVREELISRDPSAAVQRFKEENAPREFLTRDELQRLVATPWPDEKTGRAFLFSCLTGLRWSDVVPLRWGDFTELDGRHRLVFAQHKTGGLEYLDISRQAYAALGDPGAPDGLVFDGISSIQSARIAVAAWVKAAGISKHITFHCARHTFAVMMLDLGVDIYTVSKLLGHRSIETTQVYAKILDKNKQAAVDLIPDIGLK